MERSAESTTVVLKLQSTLVSPNYNGLSKILWYPYREISDLQNWGKNKSNNHIRSIGGHMLLTFHKWICNLTSEVRNILKILWKRGAISPLIHNILLPVSPRDKWLFEISEVEITRVDSSFNRSKPWSRSRHKHKNTIQIKEQTERIKKNSKVVRQWRHTIKNEQIKTGNELGSHWKSWLQC